MWTTKLFCLCKTGCSLFIICWRASIFASTYICMMNFYYRYYFFCRDSVVAVLDLHTWYAPAGGSCLVVAWCPGHRLALPYFYILKYIDRKCLLCLSVAFANCLVWCSRFSLFCVTEVRMAVGLFVHTRVAIPHLTCRSCNLVWFLSRMWMNEAELGRYVNKLDPLTHSHCALLHVYARVRVSVCACVRACVRAFVRACVRVYMHLLITPACYARCIIRISTWTVMCV